MKKQPTKKELRALLEEARREVRTSELALAIANRALEKANGQLNAIAFARVHRVHANPRILQVSYQVTEHELTASRDPEIIFDYLHRQMCDKLRTFTP